MDAALAGLAGEELLLLAAEGGALARSWVRRYLLELRPLTLGVRGADLLKAGAPPGPAIGRALAATRAARLDGEIGPEEELRHALARLAEPATAMAPEDPANSSNEPNKASEAREASDTNDGGEAAELGQRRLAHPEDQG